MTQLQFSFMDDKFKIRDIRYIFLGHWQIEVIWAKGPKHSDGTDVYGMWSSRYKTITLDTDLSDDLFLAEILWHELTHAILEYFGVDEFSSDQEIVCQAMGRGMALLLKDNPHLWEIMNDL